MELLDVKDTKDKLQAMVGFLASVERRVDDGDT